MKPPIRARLCVERLEDRTTPSYDFGYALGFGTPGIDLGIALAADSVGNVAVAGNYSTASSSPIDVDPGPGEYILPNAGGTDAFAVSYNPDGSLRWGVHFGSAGINGATELAMDSAGNTFVAGRFDGTLQIGAPGATPVSVTSASGYDGFLAKIDPSGTVLWARTLTEASVRRVAFGITTDTAGNVYATGLPDGTNHTFIAKYDGVTGVTAWSRVISGGTGKYYSSGYTSFASGQDVAVAANGTVYVTGSYLGKIDFNPDPTKANWLTSVGSSPSQDAFILALTASGSYVWSGSMGGRGIDGGLAIALDGSDNVYITGHFDVDTQSDFDPGRGKVALSSGSGFMVKLDANRNFAWARSGVGTVDLAVDAAGNAYTITSFSGSIDADPGPGTFTLTSAGANDVLLTKVNSAGTFVWAASLGGPANEQGRGIALDGLGNLYTTGSFQQTADFDPSATTYPLTSTADGSGNPTSDVFISRLSPATGPSTSSESSSDLIAAIDFVLAEESSSKRKRQAA